MTNVRLRVVPSTTRLGALSLRDEDGIGSVRTSITNKGFKPNDFVYLVKPEDEISVSDTDYFDSVYEIAKDVGLTWEYLSFCFREYAKGATLKESVNFARREWDF